LQVQGEITFGLSPLEARHDFGLVSGRLQPKVTPAAALGFTNSDVGGVDEYHINPASETRVNPAPGVV
jgi:hypothetical protein